MLADIASVKEAASAKFIATNGVEIKMKAYGVKLTTDGHNMAVGVDPGVVTAISFVHGDGAHIIQMTAPTKKVAGRIERAAAIWECAWSIGSEYSPWRTSPIAIEDASHGAGYGQSVLAENRAAFFLGLYRCWHGPNMTLVAIQRVRAQVMGHARINPKDYWKAVLPGDCADALAIGLYASEKLHV
jgi:hypothetical protein